MSCYSPLKAFPIFEETRNGRMAYKITPFEVDHLERNRISGAWQMCNDPFMSEYASDISKDFVQIPCGKCIGCRLDYAKQWANRCLLELQYHEDAWFVTLTYDDAHLIYKDAVSETTGELLHTPTLVKKHWQDFMKALRQAYAQKYDNKLRFYMCGEYGSHTYRPHYHAIIFGLKLDDLMPYSKSERGDVLYNSEWLSGIWQRGYVVVGSVTEESCSYTARYVMKKANPSYQLDVFQKANIEPEFTLMSRRPGIGYQYLEDHPDIWDFDHVYLSTSNGSVSVSPPRYFRRKALEAGDMRYFRQQLFKPDLVDSDRKLKTSETSLDYLDQLKVEEENVISRVKSLRRSI